MLAIAGTVGVLIAVARPLGLRDDDSPRTTRGPAQTPSSSRRATRAAGRRLETAAGADVTLRDLEGMPLAKARLASRAGGPACPGEACRRRIDPEAKILTQDPPSGTAVDKGDRDHPRRVERRWSQRRRHHRRRRARRFRESSDWLNPMRPQRFETPASRPVCALSRRRGPRERSCDNRRRRGAKPRRTRVVVLDVAKPPGRAARRRSGRRRHDCIRCSTRLAVGRADRVRRQRPVARTRAERSSSSRLAPAPSCARALR